MLIQPPVALAAAADLLALYGVIEGREQPILATSVLAASAFTMAVLLLGLSTDWILPVFEALPIVNGSVVSVM